MMSAAHDVEALEALLAKLRPSGKLYISQVSETASVLALSSWSTFNDVLPDGGLPRGVVELNALRALGGSTSVAFEAVRAGQARAKAAWCAWIDPEGTLYAPGAAATGVDLGRLLVLRPPRGLLGRIAVKLLNSGAFEVVVVDFDPIAGSLHRDSSWNPRGNPQGSPQANRSEPIASRAGEGRQKKAWAPEVLVRKLALAAESNGTTVLLLTDSSRPRPVPWPVSLRLELGRPAFAALAIRVAKDRRGRVGVVKTIDFPRLHRKAG